MKRRTPTQRERVLAALREEGPRGITAVDFLLPGVIDGGTPILGFAARISELGHNHTITTVGVRDKCKVFVLIEDQGHDDAAAPAVDPLFDGTVGAARPRSPYDEDDDVPRRWGA